MASARPASEGSGSEQETPDGQSRFVIPAPIEDCDDVPSPSQHRLSRASQLRQAGLDRTSDDILSLLRVSRDHLPCGAVVMQSIASTAQYLPPTGQLRLIPIYYAP